MRTGTIAWLAAIAFVAGTPLVHAQTTRTVYVSVVGDDGRVVTALGPADFELKEGGRTYDLTSAEPPDERLRVTLVVEDVLASDVSTRQGLHDLARRVIPHADISLVVVGHRSETLTEPTRDLGQFASALDVMGTRAPSGTTGAIIESLLQLFDVESTRPSSRSAVVVVALQYEPASYETPGRVLDELRRAGIVMHSVVQPGGGMGSGSGRAGDGPMLPEGPSPLADITARMVRTQILADGPRQSGGIEVLVRTRQAAAEVFRGVADQLLAQYRLTYVLPEGVQPSSRLEVKLLRNGGRLRAPTRVPN